MVFYSEANMNDSVYRELVETAARRPLNPDEERRLQGYLGAHPEARAGWEEELFLSHCLDHINPVPVPSNVTSRVMHSVRKVERRHRRAQQASWFDSLRLVTRTWQVGLAATVVVVAVAVSHQYRLKARAGLAESVVAVLSAASEPGVEVLQDFDSISNLPRDAANGDEDLLSALK
jgi:anti-sigma factor RsiW